MGHLGSRVSALLDGQLPPAEVERCWRHVHACHDCRDLVEHEGWVKARLSGLDTDGRGTADLPGRLTGALRDPDVRGPGGGSAGVPGAGGHADRPAGRGARPAVLAVGGAGAGALVLGVALLVLVPGGPDDLRPPASSLPGVDAGPAGGTRAPQPVLPGHRFVPVGRVAP